MHILIVDDEEKQRELLAGFLKKKGYGVDTAISGHEAIVKIQNTSYDLVVLDLKMPDLDGIETMTRMRQIDPQTYFVILTGYGTVESAVTAMKEGAYDYLNKPLNLDELELIIDRIYQAQRIHQELESLRDEVREETRFESFIAESKPMKEVMSLISRVAKSNSTILILGPSGTGKELVARMIHEAGSRKDNRFIPISCAALPETLLESELFGYERGAFSGAQKRKLGKFELAHQGTLFLDEIGDLPVSTQVKLLRVLQEFSFERLGSNTPIRIDVRLISATNQDLRKKVEQGTFREDLYYRLNVISINIPPLKERKDDIEPLAESFRKRFTLKHKKPIRGFSANALRHLLRYDWPGNVRELENVIERAVVLCRHDTIEAEDIALDTALTADHDQEALRDIERDHLRRILIKTNWNLSEAAKRLMIHRNTLRLKIKEYGIKKE